MAGGSEVMLCLKCRYSLKALPRGVCPECGKEFDAGDPATFFVPRMFMLSAGWSRAPDWGQFVVAGLASIVVLAAHWNVGTNLLLVIVAVGAWAGLLAMALVRSGLRLVPQQRHRLRIARNAYWKRIGALASILGATLFMVWFEVPLKCRYLLNFPALRAVADEMAQSGFAVLDLNRQRPELPTAVAAFKIGEGQAIEVIPRFHASLPWNDDDRWEKDWFVWRSYSGVARFKRSPPKRITQRVINGAGPNGTWTHRYEIVFEHMWGNWYLFSWEFQYDFQECPKPVVR